MFRLPLDEARARLREIPQVRNVSFARKWPQTLVINVEERTPYAFWSVGGRDFAVDVEGVVIGPAVPDGHGPHIVEVDAARIMGPGDRVHPDALALAVRITQEAPRFLGQTVRELEYRPGVGVTAVLSGGMRVTFGDERSYDYKVAVLAKLLDQLSAKGQTPSAVDLRFGERVTYE
jgi:cell division protein FtsQ